MEETEPINPYAAPKAQSPLTEDGRNPGQPRRPRSVKWATFVFGLFTLVMSVLYWQASSAHGAQMILQQALFDPVLLLPIGFALSFLGGRRKVAYYVNSGILAIIAVKLPWNLFFYRWVTKGAFEKMFLFDRCFEAVMCGLLCYLFCRFTFGLPSRRYFGFAPVN